MEHKELISSVKGIVSRLNSFGQRKEDVRNLFVMLFLLRWMKEELSSYAEYSGGESASRVSSHLDYLFSHELEHHHAESLVKDAIDGIRDELRVQAFVNIDFTSIRHSFDDKRIFMEAVRWLQNWGGFSIDTRREASELFEVILQENKTEQSSFFSSGKFLSQLVIELAQPKSGESILDPCAGEGNFLLAAQQSIDLSSESFQSKTAFTGYDLSEESLIIAMIRLLLSGAFDFNLDKKSGLHDDYYSATSSELFDLVLAHPPAGLRNEGYRQLSSEHRFRVPTKDVLGLFVQQTLSALKPNGRAVIALPEGFLLGNSRENIELRRFIVESNYVEAVIGLPPKVLIENSSIRGALLVLNKSKKSRKIRMADLSPYFELTSSKRVQALPQALIVDLVRRIKADSLPEPIPLPEGMREGMTGSGVSTRAIWDVDSNSIAENNWDLTPKKQVDDSLSELLKGFRSQIGSEIVIEKLSKLAQTNLGRMVRSSELTDIENSYGYIRIRDINSLKVKAVTSWLPEEIALINHKSQLFEGDILLSKTGTIGKLALIDRESEGAFAGSNFYILRTNKAKVIPEYLLLYLATSFCQDWLDNRKRGAVQQHIINDVIKSLPVVLPSLELQKRAVSQYQDIGTDVITFLKENGQQSQVNGIENLLEAMKASMSEMVGNDFDIAKTAYLLSEMSKNALSSEGALKQLKSGKKDWCDYALKILNLIKDLHKIPPGSVLLNMLQEVNTLISQLTTSTPGNYNQEERLIRAFTFIRSRTEMIADKVMSHVNVDITPSVKELVIGSEVEFQILLDNQSYLPLKNMIVETSPNIGSGETYYLADKEQMNVALACLTNNTDDSLVFKVLWRAETLAGQQVGGSSEIAIKLSKQKSEFKSFKLASNPYVTGSPLEPKSGAMVFYGRDNLIQQMVRQIETQGNVILLEGNRRAGKTSILKHLEGVDTIPNWLVVYCSLQGAEGASGAVGVPTAEVFREIARTIASAITKLKIDVPLPDGKIILAGKPALGIARACKQGIGEDSPFIDFREYLEVILSILEEKDLGIVLMLDEFDKLQEGIDNGVTSPQVPENLRYLIQNYPRFSAVLTGSRRLKRLREEYWSALYGLGTNLAVTALDTDSAEKVVKEPVKDFIAFSNEAVALILELTARQAYLIQKVCNRIFDYAATKGIHSIKSEDVLHIASELVQADEHFASLWDYAKLGPETGRYRRQALLYILTKNFKNETLCTFGMLQEELSQKGITTCDESLDADISYLRELELIKLCGGIGVGHYRLEIPLMAEWIKVHEDEEIVIKNAVNEEGSISDR